MYEPRGIIEHGQPANWRALQDQVGRILEESGFVVEVDEELAIARGKVAVDVIAQDPLSSPPLLYVCECKYWSRRVPKTVVHAFRTVVSDLGANVGLIISCRGYQSGASEAAQYTNVRLLTWQEFQELFVERWYEKHFVPALRSVAEPLVDYTEPINSRVFRKADALDSSRQEQFRELRSVYNDLAFLALPLYLRLPGLAALSAGVRRRVGLPLRSSLRVQVSTATPSVSNDLLDCDNYRQLLEMLSQKIEKGVDEFDLLFRERA
jgi:restriction system protein